MQYLPSSFNKVLSKYQHKQNEPTIPQFGSQVTLFDDLPESEKQAALAKLHDLAGQQPGSSAKKTHRRFNWKIFAMAFTFLSLLVLAIVATVYAVDKDVNPELTSKLRMANTNLDRMKLLPDNKDWFFDFTKQEKYTFTPGGVTNANAATFPATAGLGMTLAMLNLGPCSMLPPHIHPRATNFVVAVSGQTRTFMVAENGAQTIEETLNPGQMTIFPQASVHTMMNVGCENAQLVSALSSDDAGTTNLANTFFSLPTNFTGTILGPSVNIASTQSHIPAVGTGSNYGPEQCIAACRAKGKMIKREW